MDSDEYWRLLVERVFHRNEQLHGADDDFYRLACVYGECASGGIESYLDSRLEEFEQDMKTLERHSFEDVASLLRDALAAICSGNNTSRAVFNEAYSRLLDEEPSVKPMQEKIDQLYGTLLARLDALCDYKFEYGLKEGLYSRVVE